MQVVAVVLVKMVQVVVQVVQVVVVLAIQVGLEPQELLIQVVVVVVVMQVVVQAVLVLSSCATPTPTQSPILAAALHLPLQRMAAIKLQLLLPALAMYPSQHNYGTLRIP
jgi:hypothetical protein